MTVTAEVRGGTTHVVARYLPSNYRVTDERDGVVYIEGEDVGGWTFDLYVQPRLASGLMAATRTTVDAGTTEETS